MPRYTVPVTLQDAVPLIRFEHVAGPFVGTDCKSDISQPDINASGRRADPRLAVAMYRTRGQYATGPAARREKHPLGYDSLGPSLGGRQRALEAERRTPDMPLRDTLQTILTDYAKAKADPPKGHSLGDFIRMLLATHPSGFSRPYRASSWLGACCRSPDSTLAMLRIAARRC